MDDWKEHAKAARDGFEEERLKYRRISRDGKHYVQPPVNTTLAEIYVILCDSWDITEDEESLMARIEAGPAIWKRIGIRFALRILWYRIRWAIWKWRNR